MAYENSNISTFQYYTKLQNSDVINFEYVYPCTWAGGYPALNNINEESFILNLKSNSFAVCHYAVYNEGSNKTTEEVKEASGAITCGSIFLNNYEHIETVGIYNSLTPYDVYLVLEDENNIQQEYGNTPTTARKISVLMAQINGGEDMSAVLEKVSLGICTVKFAKILGYDTSGNAIYDTNIIDMGNTHDGGNVVLSIKETFTGHKITQGGDNIVQKIVTGTEGKATMSILLDYNKIAKLSNTIVPASTDGSDILLVTAVASTEIFTKAAHGLTAGSKVKVAGIGTSVAYNSTASASIGTNPLITATGHGLSLGDKIVWSALTGGTGITLKETYTISSVPDADTFKMVDSNGTVVTIVTTALTAAKFNKQATGAGLVADTYLVATVASTSTFTLSNLSGTPVELLLDLTNAVVTPITESSSQFSIVSNVGKSVVTGKLMLHPTSEGGSTLLDVVIPKSSPTVEIAVDYKSQGKAECKIEFEAMMVLGGTDKGVIAKLGYAS